MAKSSHWGKNAPDYFSSYNLDAALLPTDRSRSAADREAMRKIALQGVRQAGLLVRGKKGSDLDMEKIANLVPLSQLQTILELSHWPDSFRCFTSLNLLTLCVRLMSVVQVSGKPSPFSFEYGYTCFRIAMLTCGVILLQRTKDLERVVAEMHAEPGRLPSQVFSVGVAKTIEKEFDSPQHLDHCDYILGWAQWEGCPHLQPLLHISDASLLLDLLFDDRKHYLEALLSTYSPGLSGIFFVLWRCWRRERLEKAGDHLRERMQATSPFLEILRRYSLAVATDQSDVLNLIYGDVAEEAPGCQVGFIDAEDSRSIVRAYVDRVCRYDGLLHGDMDPGAVPILIGFVGRYLERDARDMFPLLVERTIQHMWEMRLNRSDLWTTKQIVDGMQMAVAGLATVNNNIQPIPSGLALELVESVINEDLLGLTICSMTNLNLLFEKTTGTETSPYAHFLAESLGFLKAICSALPKPVVQSKFSNTSLDWAKYKLYFNWRSEAIGQSPSEQKHWVLCGEYLRAIPALTQQSEQMDTLETNSMQCAYPRCSDPSHKLGAQFACAKCLKFYCSMRCQTADWARFGRPMSHKDECAELPPVDPGKRDDEGKVEKSS